MSYTIDKTSQLAEAVKKGYKALASQLRAEGVPTKQHNVGVKTSQRHPKDEPTARTVAAKKTAKKTASKKSTTKKTAAKKTTTKKS